MPVLLIADGTLGIYLDLWSAGRLFQLEAGSKLIPAMGEAIDGPNFHHLQYISIYKSGPEWKFPYGPLRFSTNAVDRELVLKRAPPPAVPK